MKRALLAHFLFYFKLKSIFDPTFIFFILGAADRSGLIHVGDEVIEVNNINVEGKTPGDVLQILVRTTCPIFVT
jgi:hypothetical protein